MPGERVGQADCVVVQVDVVDEHAVRERAPAGYQAGAIRGADRAAGYGAGEIHALLRQPVEVRRFHVRIPGVASRLRPPLVAENDNDVGSFHLPWRQTMAQSQRSCRKQYCVSGIAGQAVRLMVFLKCERTYNRPPKKCVKSKTKKRQEDYSHKEFFSERQPSEARLPLKWLYLGEFMPVRRKMKFGGAR